MRLCGFHLFLAYIVSLELIAQQNLAIRGYVIDKEDGEPVPYATITVSDASLFAISNDDGYFEFRLPGSYSADTLFISHVGYINRQFPITTLRDRDSRLLLKQDVIMLDQMIVTNDPARFAKDVVEKAIDRIPVNYPVEPFRTGRLFQETSQNQMEPVFRFSMRPFNCMMSTPYDPYDPSFWKTYNLIPFTKENQISWGEKKSGFSNTSC